MFKHNSLATLASQLPFWIQLTRQDRPIGWLVLLWPTWIALIYAGELTHHQPALWVIFTLGVIVMRSAGCIVNDYADREFDRHVKRTIHRPLTSGALSIREAAYLLSALLAIAVILVLFTNLKTMGLAILALGSAVLYPFLKRMTFWPQLGLGIAFSMAIPMAFTAHDAPFNATMWWLIAANLAWTLVYDTFYAMVDRDDDLMIGVKSTAIAFGSFDLMAIGLAQMVALGCFAAMMWTMSAGFTAYLGLLGGALMMIRHQIMAHDRSREGCFRAFLDNHRFGALVCVAIAFDVLIHRIA